MNDNQLLWRTLRYVEANKKFSEVLKTSYIKSIIGVGFVRMIGSFESTEVKAQLTSSGKEMLKLLEPLFLN